MGQRLVQLLEGHPWFELTDVVASERSAGRPYAEAASWRLSSPIPAAARRLPVKALGADLECQLALSALDAAVAGEAEACLAKAGLPVVSNARHHRMEADVPLIIPEVNWEHTRVLALQRSNRGWAEGLIATNPNCSAVGLTMVLKPLLDAFGVEQVQVVTMQALSGAGVGGVAGMAILDNLIPHIEGEEEKVEQEPLKILGELREGHFQPAQVEISAQCHRVAVLDGHTEAVSVRLTQTASLAEVRQALADFTSEPQRLGLPSAPVHPVVVLDQTDRPQPLLDRGAGGGMSVSVGRIRPCPILDWKFDLVVHNTIRGAAGAALLNAELLVAQGYLRP